MSRILIVEDEPLVRRALVRLLWRHTVVTAPNGHAALTLLRQDDAFDLILCDMMMPRLSGQGLYEALDGSACRTRFVFMTASTSLAQQKFMKESGRLILYKPVMPVDLLRLADEPGLALRDASSPDADPHHPHGPHPAV